MLNPLYHLVAHTIVFIHGGLGPIFGKHSFLSWALSIVLLTMLVRLILFPLFVKQIKSQRALQMMQPRMKEIREKHKNDKQRMNAEMMALQKEHGNPLLGCLPIFAQIPLFFSLFHVLNSLKPVLDHGRYVYHASKSTGLSAATVQSIATAKLGGVTVATAFTSGKTLITTLGANATHVKILAVILIVTMSATTFITQKQIMGRNGPVDPSQATQQKVLLYLSPLFLGVFGFRFPIGVLLYWLTTNFWSMGQQFVVLRKMPPVVPLGTGGTGGTGGSGGSGGARPGVGPTGGGARPGAPAGAARKRGKEVPAPPAPPVRQKQVRAGQPGRSGDGAGVPVATRGLQARNGRAERQDGSGGADEGRVPLTKDPAANMQKLSEPVRETPPQTPTPGRGRGPAAPAEGPQRPPSPAVAAVEARRPSGGGPAKRRGKGGRRGGRH